MFTFLLYIFHWLIKISDDLAKYYAMYTCTLNKRIAFCKLLTHMYKPQAVMQYKAFQSKNFKCLFYTAMQTDRFSRQCSEFFKNEFEECLYLVQESEERRQKSWSKVTQGTIQNSGYTFCIIQKVPYLKTLTVGQFLQPRGQTLITSTLKLFDNNDSIGWMLIISQQVRYNL